MSEKFEFLTDECVSDHNERITSMQIDPFRPTDDEVVHSKRPGNKVFVHLY